MANPLDDGKLALRARDAAKALSVCERTLATWTKTGIVPSIKISGTVLYPVDALRAALQKMLDEQAAKGVASDE